MQGEQFGPSQTAPEPVIPPVQQTSSQKILAIKSDINPSAPVKTQVDETKGPECAKDISIYSVENPIWDVVNIVFFFYSSRLNVLQSC